MLPDRKRYKYIIAVDNYDQIDNPNGQSDAKALALGEARYNSNDISARVLRFNNNNKLSPQSEELPLHRVLDLSILILIRTLIAQGKNDPNYPNNPILKNIQEFNPNNDIAKLDAYLQNYQELYPRIDEIKRLIALF